MFYVVTFKEILIIRYFEQKEVISLHVGQFGVQFGNALWELYCLEHGILPNGELQDSVIDQAGISGFYEEGINRRFSPRAVYCDLEPSVIGKEVTSSLCRFFGTS